MPPSSGDPDDIARRGAEELARFLFRPIVFQQPHRTAYPPSWLEHIPFAFWMIDALRPRTFVELGTHSGNSYAAFAQAIQMLQVPTAAYAIDTWRGDEHSGLYGDEVFEEWARYHDLHYSSFSRLIRSTFEEAVEHFSDGTIDLLHVDGYHTYDAAAADLERWRPKLSPRSVIVLHDINVRERDFGTWRLWQELRAHSPHFEFLHGHGLGILGVGSDLPLPLQWLFSPGADVQQIRTFFGHLGGAVLAKYALGRAQQEIDQQKVESARLAGANQPAAAAAAQEPSTPDGPTAYEAIAVAERDDARAQAETLRQELDQVTANLVASNAELVALRATAQAQTDASDWLKRQVRDGETRAQTLEAQLAELKPRLASAVDDSEWFARQAHEREVRGRTLEEQVAELMTRLTAALDENIRLRTELRVMETSHSWRLTRSLRDVRRETGRMVARLRSTATPAARSAAPAPEHGPAAASEPAAATAEPPRSAPPAPAVVLSGGPSGGPHTHHGPLPSWIYQETATDYVALDRATPVETRIKLIAFYLPQFHPIPENDASWGKGFTEWTNVTRAKPQFPGHHQPHLPGELGFYDLRLFDVQRRQIELAKLYGIHGFCYHHYWFGGTRLLREPLDQLLAHPEIDFPFCLCWANENWTRRWDGRDDEVLIAQQHSAEDDIAFLRDIEPALRDPRYIRVNGRPLLIVYRPALLMNAYATAKRWRTYCREIGIGELFLATTQSFDNRHPRDFGFDAAIEFPPNNLDVRQITSEVAGLNPDFHGAVFDYRSMVQDAMRRDAPDGYTLFRGVTPMWDNEARRPSRGHVIAHSTPDRYRDWLESACRWTERHTDSDKPFVFVNAWNEWAEGCHLEPDRRHGYAYLKATADALERFPARARRPSIVCVSHDAHLHGGQLIALTLARTLSQRLNYDVTTILCGLGTLTSDFEAAGRVHDFSAPDQTRDEKLSIVRQLYDQGARVAICNTSVVGEVAELLKLTGFSVVSLIHELPGLINAYNLRASIDRIAEHADHLVFPARIVRDKFNEIVGLPRERGIIQPQGLLAPNTFFGRREVARDALRADLGLLGRTRIALGVGFADHRKGIDWFIDVGVRVAKQAQDIVFVWVGHHEPQEFARACARLEDEHLRSRFLFPGSTRNSSLFFAGADAYLMTSREDPFPSVVVEAIDAGLPVIGFEGAGGFVELLERGCGVLVPFGDTAAMAQALMRLLGSPGEAERLASTGREILSREFSFVNYARRLTELVAPGGPKVSVVVPNYNYARYLPGRLKSIVDQTYPPSEILFLDDCSTDNSLEVAEAILHASGLSYRIIKNTINQGTYRQWLRGFRESTGDLIWIAEADDECTPELLERLVAQFRDPEVMLAYCQSRQIDQDGREIAPDYLAYTSEISDTKWREQHVRPGLHEIRDTLVVKNTIPNASAVLMRRTDISAIETRLLSLRNTGDWLLYIHLLEKGNIAFVPESLNSHRRHGTSATIGGNALNLMREIVMVQQYVLERHGSDPATEMKREISLQSTYEYLGLNASGPALYKAHEALKELTWTTR